MSGRPRCSGRHGVQGRSRLGVMAVVAWVLLAGCATGRQVSAVPPEGGSGGGFFSREEDAFQLVQEAGGLEEADRLPVGRGLRPEWARRLLSELEGAPVKLKSFGSRLTLTWLLREAVEGGEPVAYEELLRRTLRFERLVVVRPDGYLAVALSGRPLQSMGPVRLEEGVLRAGRLEVGAFYLSRGGVFYPVDESLEQAEAEPWAELGLERDWLNAALDGSEDALVEMGLGLGQFFSDPIRGVEGLYQLPSGVAALIATSPEYLERYGDMPLGEQIREAARLSTHLLTLYGSASGTVASLGSSGLGLKVLSLTGEGLVVTETVGVSAGTMVTTVGVGAGAANIVHMASRGKRSVGGGRPKVGRPAPAKGPGRWVTKKPTTKSPRALRYQEQITGRPASRVYEIDGVEFDGFPQHELQEAKGPGYRSFFDKKGEPQYWYKNSGSLKELLTQARRQSEIAERLGLPMRWYVAEAEMVEILRRLFKNEDIRGIDIIHRSPK